MGVAACIGVPGSGKSKLAVALASAESKRSGRPILAVDPGRVWNFEKWMHAGSVEAVVTALWQDRADVAWTPDESGGLEEFDRVMSAAGAAGGVIILIDEVRWYASAQFLSRPLSILARTWRHRNVDLFLTTQRFGDLHQDLVACLTKLYVFCCSSPRDLERLTREFGLSREEIVAQKPDENIPHVVGFAA